MLRGEWVNWMKTKKRKKRKPVVYANHYAVSSIADSVSKMGEHREREYQKVLALRKLVMELVTSGVLRHDELAKTGDGYRAVWSIVAYPR